MLIINVKKEVVTCSDLIHNTINVVDTAVFSKAVNTILCKSEALYRECKEMSMTDEELLQAEEDGVITANFFNDCISAGKISAVEITRVKGEEVRKTYTLPLYKDVADIKKDGIYTQALIYCVAMTGGKVANCIQPSNNGTWKPMPAVMPKYHEFYDLARKYYDTGSSDETLVIECKRLVESLGSRFNTQEAGGLLKKYEYSVKRKDVRTAMNIAVETLKFGRDGSIVTRRMRNAKSASVQLAMLMLHIKVETKKVKAENWIVF